MPFHKYILNFLHCNVFAEEKLVAMTFEVTHVCKKEIAAYPSISRSQTALT
jgi:hypothetical protein